jgi:excisionase family DNA binding protein
MAERFLTVTEVSALSQLHPEVIRRAIRRGELVAMKPCGRLRIRPSDYDAWLEGTRVDRDA